MKKRIDVPPRRMQDADHFDAVIMGLIGNDEVSVTLDLESAYSIQIGPSCRV